MKAALLFFYLCPLGCSAVLPTTQDVLRRAGIEIEKFWQQLSAVSCVETVQQLKLAPDGKVLYRQDASFDYLVLLQLTGNDILVDESRAPIGEAGPHRSVPVLVTNGFSTLAFIFHPVFQNAFEYSPPEPSQLDGREVLAVRFQHVAGARSPSVLKVRDQQYPVPWQGTAWIDASSGAILRITAAIMPGLGDLGLKTITADVIYAPVEFKDDPARYWLPATATIEVETERQHWRNIHSFARYRLFSVDVKSSVETPK
jgi:hypothetical protein